MFFTGFSRFIMIFVPFNHYFGTKNMIYDLDMRKIRGQDPELDPDPDSQNLLDPDPDSTNPDPQH